MRLLFAGTPEVALPSLRALLDGPHEVVAVLTRPDAPGRRGRDLHPSPVAALAADAGVEVLKYARPRDPEFLDRLAALAVDAAPIVAYGGLIPAAALVLPTHGWVNLHFSLLPAWRGAAPVQHAVLAGDEITGACTFRLEEGLDTGPVYGTVTEPIGPTDTSGDLLGRLAVTGAELLSRTLDLIAAGAADPQPQPADGVSLAPKLTPQDARIDWSVPAFAVDRRVRACTPAPGAWTTLAGERVKVGPVAIAEADGGADLAPGRMAADRAGVLVGTGSGAVRLSTVQPAGKKAMAAADWVRGLRADGDLTLGG
jgi:methionyl-tRNA formyltransferase